MNQIETKRARAEAYRAATAIHEGVAAGDKLSAADQHRFDGLLAECRRHDEALARFEKLNTSTHRDGASLGGGGEGDTELREWFGQEVRSIASGAFSSSLVPDEFVPRIFDRLRPRCVALQTGAVEMKVSAAEVHLPLLSSDTTSNWVNEGAQITSAAAAGTEVTVKIEKAAALVSATRELIEDADVDVSSILLDNLGQSLAQTLDSAAWFGTGVPPVPFGLHAVAGITTQSMGANGAKPTLDTFLEGISTLASASANLDTSVIVMSARTFGTVIRLVDSQGRPIMNGITDGGAPRLRIGGLPVFVTNQISDAQTKGTANNASSCFIYDAAQHVVCHNGTIRLESNLGPFWDTDVVGFRAVIRCGYGFMNPAACVEVVGLLP